MNMGVSYLINQEILRLKILSRVKYEQQSQDVIKPSESVPYVTLDAHDRRRFLLKADT